MSQCGEVEIRVSASRSSGRQDVDDMVKRSTAICSRITEKFYLGGLIMKRKIRKALFLLVIVVFIASLISCKSTTENENVSTTNVTTTKGTTNVTTTKGTTIETTNELEESSLEKQLEISWLGWTQNGSIGDDTPIQKMIEEKFNVVIKQVKVSVSNTEQVQLMKAAGDMPDYFWTYTDPYADYKDGIIRTIPKNMIEKYLPGHYELMENNPPGLMMGLAPDSEDEYVTLYGVWEGRNIDAEILPFIRLDWMESAGISPPGPIEQMGSNGPLSQIFLSRGQFTLNQLEDILVAFKEMSSDVIPMAAFDSRDMSFRTIMGAFGVQMYSNMSSILDKKTGEALPWEITSQYKDSLKLLARWYNLGLIDREFATNDRNRWNEKIASGNVGYFLSHSWWTDADWASTRAPQNLLKNDDVKLLVLWPESGPQGDYGYGSSSPVTSVSTQYNVLIGNNTSDEKLIRILKIMQWANFDTEAKILTFHGREGIDFEWSGEPYKSMTVQTPGIDATVPPLWLFAHVYYTYDFLVTMRTPGFVKGLAFSNELPSIVKQPYTHDMMKSTQLLDYSARYGAALETIRDEYYLQAITGSVDIDSTWDDYVGRYLKSGGEMIVEEIKTSPRVSDLLLGKFE